MTHEKDQILFISSYPPRECGIATFTQDLITGFNKIFSKSFNVRVCALNEDETVKRSYPEEVSMTLDTGDITQCLSVAAAINNDPRIVSVVIEHEFGLFKGNYGENLFYVLDEIMKPVFVCFHTVLANPDPRLLHVVQKIAAKAQKLIVLTEHSRNMLHEHYEVPRSHVEVIPHGIHLTKPIMSKTALKTKYGFGDKILLGTFGLISSNKGIESALEAIAQLPETDRKNILYLVMGKTHPCVYRHEGETYREFLIQKTKDLGIEDHVLFINKYLDLEELLLYLSLTDIYMFTSKDPMQTVSGTLSYAMGAGCTLISTPIPHAQEMLQDGSGYIFDFGNSRQLCAIVQHLLENPEEMKKTSHLSMRKARSNSWENVAIRFGRMIGNTTGKLLQYCHPPLQLEHFCRLTNPLGMVQFANMCEPDIESGYTTDDNARALYVLTLYHEIYPKDPLVHKYFDVYLNFLQRVCLPDGRFLNYMDHDSRFPEQNLRENLDEANARAFVALCRFVQSPDVPVALKARALNTINRFLKNLYAIQSPRSVAKFIKGLYFLYRPG